MRSCARIADAPAGASEPSPALALARHAPYNAPRRVIRGAGAAPPFSRGIFTLARARFGELAISPAATRIISLPL